MYSSFQKHSFNLTGPNCEDSNVPKDAYILPIWMNTSLILHLINHKVNETFNIWVPGSWQEIIRDIKFITALAKWFLLKIKD